MSKLQDTTPVERAFRLIEYLLRLASLRMRLVRDVEDYERVLWISDIPKQKGCFTQAWGRDEAFDSEIWVELQNRREPELPAVPDQCKDWVDNNSLRNKSDFPGLRPEIARQIRNPNWREGSDQSEFIERLERLDDHPSVKKAWDRFLEERWFQWTQDHNDWETVHQVYSSLFAIHQEQLRLGEEYELVLAFGLLIWKTPTGQLVRRHLITANAMLEFDARLSRFTVRPNLDGANVRTELDMLDIEDQPARAEEAAKEGLLSAADDPWEKSCIEGVLSALVHSINPNGEYNKTLAREDIRAGEKPVVSYTPAIILRKRSTKGLTETLKRIAERIEEGESIPSEFRDLAELTPSTDSRTDRDPDDSNEECDGEIYFPKPSNDEQRRIVGKLRVANGVLVQGPPGTGKSHTIANLICHLLAIGNRILITAKTPRALKVLMGDIYAEEPSNERRISKSEGLVPSELRPLCINLLGSGLDEKRSLESSVGGILRKNEEWDSNRAATKLAANEKRLHELREEKAKLERRLRDIRESETHSQSIGEGAYRGTAAQIAQSINRDRETFTWFTDSIPPNQSCPIAGHDFQQVLKALRWFTPEKRQEIKLIWPDSLSSPSQLYELFNRESKSIEGETRSATGSDQAIAESMSKVEASTIRTLMETDTAFQDRRRRLITTAHPWMSEAVRDIISGNPHSWRELCRVTRNTIAVVESLVPEADAARLDITGQVHMETLLDDVCKLQKHIENGGNLGWGPFRPRSVRERSYVLKNVRVNGHRCADLEQMRRLSNVMRVRVEFQKTWGFWTGRCDPTQGPYAIQLQTLKAICDALDTAFSLEVLIEEGRNIFRMCPSLREPTWIDELEVETLNATCKLALAQIERRQVTEEIRRIELPIASIIAKYNAHPVARESLSAIRSRDIDAYSSTYEATLKLTEERSSVQQLENKLSNLRQSMPRLSKDVESNAGDARWDMRARQIPDAWNWAQARIHIEEYLRKEDVPALAARAKQVEDDVNAIMAEIASLRAWTYCFSRLNESHRRHMKAWQKNVSKLTKSGTGKQDLFHRREAQKNLNNCREAIPAWVMPIHRIWDTVDPAPEMFDVIIVDEASQCGFEALPLFYLGKKILIVGDDKQIGPEAEGIKLDPVTQLIDQFLFDFEHKSSFNINRSLFDHGELRYSSNHVVLREHFRCMPEIIRFSNDLCYRDTPLIPLRQYGPNRLVPLQRVFLEGGFREGSDSRAVNRSEADAIAKKIAELCRDPKYAGKTMGVVVLQGDAQGGLIEAALLALMGAEEMDKRRLVCGNSYSFQGDQRDIMFLSMVAAPNERIGALNKAADERRFNVAASRARDQMWLFHSVTRNDLSSSCLRRRLLEFFEGTKQQEVGSINREELERRAAQDNRMVLKAPKPFDSWFEVDVALELLRRDFYIIPQFPVAGKYIDLVVEGGHARLAVECDGDEVHGVEQYEADMQRQRMLERCGWEFFRVRKSAFVMDREQALKGLWRLLEERDIFPGPLATHTNLAEGDSDATDESIDSADEDDARDEENSTEELLLFDDSPNNNGTHRRRPDQVSASEIQQAIIQSLEQCPNHTCTLQSLTSRVLRELGVLTRGSPRQEFEKRVMRNLAILETKEITERYRAKNKRVKLLKSGF